MSAIIGPPLSPFDPLSKLLSSDQRNQRRIPCCKQIQNTEYIGPWVIKCKVCKKQTNFYGKEGDICTCQHCGHKGSIRSL